LARDKVGRFRQPIVRGMSRSSSNERKRQRILNDDEIRSVWIATGEFPDAYGALVRFLLLTGARRAEAAEMPRSELQNGVWLLPGARNKAKVDIARPLFSAAQDVLPPFDGKYVFGRDDGARPMGCFGFFKERFDEACGVTDWTLHDLRRTARSLMGRAGVPTDHAERCLGHVIGGVRGVYDCWQYVPQMREAYEALAGLIERIVDPVDNVTAFAALRTRSSIVSYSVPRR
jgi:integrase